MRASWNLPGNSEIPLEGWGVERVILDYNGPQLVSMKAGDKLYIAVASDEDEKRERWVRAPISKSELEAVLCRATPLFDAFIKDKLTIVDLDRRTNQPIVAWHVPGGEVAPENLPRPGALLSKAASIDIIENVSPQLQLDSIEHDSNRVNFAALGDVLRDLQRLWNALAQVVVGKETQRGHLTHALRDRAAMAAAGLGPGSVVIDIRTGDEKLFNLIAVRYRELVSAQSDTRRLYDLMANLGVRVRSTYKDYLKALEKHKVEVYAKWGVDRVHINPYRAKRIRPKLDLVELGKEEQQEIVGYFVGFNVREAKFEFFDVVEEETYTGSVDASLLTEKAEFVVGASAMYEATISVLSVRDTVAGVSQQNKLLRASRVASV